MTRDHDDSSKFRELDVLRDGLGLKAVISQRVATGLITFAIVKEFDRDGIPWATGFIPETMIEQYKALVPKVLVRITELRADPKTIPYCPPLPRVAAGAR